MTKGMNTLMQQAQKMQQKITVLQKELETRELEVSSGGGMVKIKINGKNEIINLTIDKQCINLEDKEALEEMLKVAVNQAVKEAQDMVSKAMSKVTGGINIPGLF